MRVESFTIQFTAALVLLGAPALAQTSATKTPITAAPATLTHTNEIGFSYRLPADWDFVEQQPKPTTSVPKPEETQKFQIPDSKNGADCIQVALTARHGNPSSAIVAVMLPFGCYGQTMVQADLPGFGDGAAEGLKQAFDIAASTSSTYTLEHHSLWIERATGTAKGQQNAPVSTLEIVCAMLNKGAVCWMAVAVDDAALKTFENGLVTLDGGPAHPLVPPEAIAKLADPAAQK